MDRRILPVTELPRRRRHMSYPLILAGAAAIAFALWGGGYLVLHMTGVLP